jgi:glycosyltransferase involved in cell wall biosynthesis
VKTLFVTPFSPYPPDFGGAIRIYHMLKMFASLSDVTLLMYAGRGPSGDSVGHLETICERVVAVPGPPTEAAPKWLLQARGTLGSRPFQYFAHYSQRFQRALDETIQATPFDYVVVNLSQMGYFRYPRIAGSYILDLQNIEFELLERRAAVQSHPLRRAALALEARKFRRDELAICRRFDLIFTPSERERDQLRALLGPSAITCLPNSIDPDYFAMRATEPPGNEIAFIGTTHVDANRDGLVYFMERIFPLIERRVPDVRFSIVGGNPPPVIRQYGARPNVEVTGYVKDVRPYMARARALVVPLRSGGGTRLKILEGLSFGVPTVSTTIGAEGLDLVHGEHILLGDTPEAFAAGVVAALGDAGLRQRLRAAGRAVVEQRYSWQAVGRVLEQHLRGIARPEPAAGGSPKLAESPR